MNILWESQCTRPLNLTNDVNQHGNRAQGWNLPLKVTMAKPAALLDLLKQGLRFL